MDLKDLTTAVFFRSLFDAAERFYEKDPATALEIYHSYFRYAFGETDDIETDNVVAELLVKQNVPSLDAATNRYITACNKGLKGKENGGGIGRPKKGETQEEYQKRVAEWKENRAKNPQKPSNNPKGFLDNNPNENPIKNPVIPKSPSDASQNPQKPLTKAYSISNSISKDISISKENKLPTCKIDIEKEKESIENNDDKNDFHYYSSKIKLDDNKLNTCFETCKNFVSTYNYLDYQELIDKPEDFLNKNEIRISALTQSLTNNTGLTFQKDKTIQLLKEYCVQSSSSY